MAQWPHRVAEHMQQTGLDETEVLGPYCCILPPQVVF